MTVGHILEGKGRDVVTMKPTASLGEAAATLAVRRIGALVVVGNDEEVVGIVSERDIVRMIGTRGADCLSGSIATAMTQDVTTCTESTSVHEAMEIMTQGRFRHIPVCEDGRLVGIVSIGDVVKRRIEEVEREADDMRQYIATG